MSDQQLVKRAQAVELPALSIGAAFLTAAARSPQAPALLATDCAVFYRALRD